MKGSFVKDCLLFQSKETLHKFLGLYFWLNILQLILLLKKV